MKRVISVVIGNALREFDKEYHYIIPDRIKESVEPGMRVMVPFGKTNRAREAYVLKFVYNVETSCLKEIKKVIDDGPVLNKGMLELAVWMKDRYICTYSDAIKCMLPAGTGIKSTRIVRLARYNDELSPGALKIMDSLSENGNECEYNELREKIGTGNFYRNMKMLREKGYVNVYESYTTRVKEKTVRAAYLAMSADEVAEEIESLRIRRIQQIRVLEILMDNDCIPVADLAGFAGVSPGVLNTLKKYGYIDFKDIEVNRDPLKTRRVEKTSPLKPTREQEMALEKLKQNVDSKKFCEVLLHGVTGSGKTEVYMQLIEYIIDKGKQSIVLVPEISLTPQMVDRFIGRFGDNVAVLHSRLSLGERYDQWRMIKDDKVRIVVGARSAVFAPLKNIGLIIIDEEHENSYKSEITPKYHASEIAAKRCADADAILLYGSATPSTDTYFRAKNGDIILIELNKRANEMVMPKVHIVDMREELAEGNRAVFSRRLSDEIERNIKEKQQTILFLNRRGYTSFVLCRSCGHTIKCLYCNISMTYHAHDKRLICHYCGYTAKVPKTCPVCKSNYIRHFGTGTQKVEEDAEKHFPGCSIIRMDADTTAYKNSHDEMLRTFREKKVDILLGTQMIAKGHDFPNVTLVGVLAADSLLNVGDYRASERTFQLITQVAGRAGRGDIPGRVVIQTYNTEDFSIVTACRHDYKAFYEQEIKIRKKLDYPPFTNIAVIILSGSNDRLAFEAAKEVRENLVKDFSSYTEKVDILGPARSPLSKIKNKYRWRIIIKCKNMHILLRVLTRVSDGFRRRKEKNRLYMSVDINPFNML